MKSAVKDKPGKAANGLNRTDAQKTRAYKMPLTIDNRKKLLTMEEFKNAVLVLLADYKSKYSAEKITSSDKIEHFLYVQNFLQEFEEKIESFAAKHFTKYHFSAAQKEEAQQYVEEIVEELASDV